jgi:gluconate 2-dehydrogenase
MNAQKPMKVFVAFPISQEAERALGTFCEYEKWNDDETHTEALFAEKIRDKDGLLLDGEPRLNKAILDQAPQLRAISNASVGYDNFDLAVMKQRGIIGTNTPGVLEDTVADLAFGLMLTVARRLCELDAYVKAGKWQPEDDAVFFGMEVHHKTLGIIGMGRIGEVFAERAIHGFHMNVLYCNRKRKPSAEARLGTEYVEMSDLLKRSDFVAVITPYTSETHHMIGSEQFAMMKKTAILINVSRGKTVDETAMIFALQNHIIAGAGLDVFKTEPIEPDNQLLRLKNVVTVPHIGSATAQTRNNMAMAAVENLRRTLAGEETNAVVPELRR